jgi:small subunit ribosomal protein S1
MLFTREENDPRMFEDTERNLNTDPSIEKEETTMKGGDAPETPSPTPGETSATSDPAEPAPSVTRPPSEEEAPVPVDLTDLRPTSKEAAPEPGAEPEAPGEPETGPDAAPEPEPEQPAEPERKGPPLPTVTDDELDEMGYSRDEYEQMSQMYDSTLKSISEGELVKGTVLAVTDTEVMLDIGFKSEGRVPIEEFPEPETIEPGDEISVLLEATEDQDGEVRVSKKKADFLQVWDKIKEAHDEQSIVEGTPKRRIKGGLKVDLFGVEAFLPGSQVALRRIPNLEELLGQKLRFRILKVNKRRRNIVISRRVVLEDERQKKKVKLLAELEVGQIRQGIVKNITDFGAFVDLGGIDGLLHITDMSWGRIRHPSELVAISDELTVKVLNFDPERERISLGLKQLAEYPWENVEEEFPVGSRVRGKVVSITDYGAFVELKEGVEGLCHISEMSWTQHIRHPSKILGIGDIVEVKVLNVNKAEEKISLSLKRTESDPWQDLDVRYPIGTRIEGRVRNLTDFGAFVQLEEGMDGLVHISDMSWTKRIKHPSEILHRGQKVEVAVLGIDKDRHRISLGIKQCLENPWPALAKQYAVGTTVEGKVSRIHKSGIVVDLPEDVEGFVPMSHLALPEINRVDARFAPGDPLPLEVIEVSPDNRRIVLSVKVHMEKQPEEALHEYVQAHDVRPELLKGEEEAGEGGKPRKEEDEKAAAEEEPEAEAKPEAEEESEAEAKPEAEEKPEAEAKPEAEETPEAEAKAEAEEKPEAEAKPEAEEKPEAEAKLEAEEKPEAEQKPEAEVAAGASEQPAAEEKAEAEPEQPSDEAAAPADEPDKKEEATPSDAA